MAIDSPSPEDGQKDKNRSICSIDSAKGMLDRLENGNHSIQSQKYKSSDAEPCGSLLSEPDPNKIAAADFAKTCYDEKNDRAHGVVHYMLGRVI